MSITRWAWCIGAVLAASCASAPRRVATVSLASAHSVISAVDDTERGLVCGRLGAPPAGSCVTEERHGEISRALAQAYRLEIVAARLVKVLPAGAPPTPEARVALAEVSRILADVIRLIPESTGKAALSKRLEAAR